MTSKAGSKLEVSTINCNLVHSYIETEQTTDSSAPPPTETPTPLTDSPSPPTDSSSTPPSNSPSPSSNSPSPPTDSSSPPTDSPSSTPPCPSGWSEFEGNCYKYFDDRMKWEDARDFCLSEQVLYYLTNISEMFLTRLIWFPFTLIKKVISWPSSPLDISSGLVERDPAPVAKTFCGLTGPRWTTRVGRLV